MQLAQQRSRRGQTRLVGFAALVVATGVAICVALGTVLVPLLRVPPGVAFAIDSASDFAPGSVALRELPAALEQFHPEAGVFTLPAGGRQPGKAPWPVRTRVSPVPVYLAVDTQGTLRAFYQVDPWSGCAFPWQPAERRFIDPCWGSSYTLSGDCVRGPCQRGLDRFVIERRLDGTLVVRIDKFEVGPPRTNAE